MKKFFLSIIIGFFPLSALAFVDIQNSEFAPFVENMAKENLISGYADGKFRPNNPVSFFEALKISTNTAKGKQEIIGQNEQDFYRDFYQKNYWQNEKNFLNNEKISRDFAIYLIIKSLGIHLENAQIKNHFSDVNPRSVFSNYINFAKNTGIISGYADGTFWPNNRVTRGEFAKIAWKTLREDRKSIWENYQILIQKDDNSQENPVIKNLATVISVADGDTISIRNSRGATQKLRIVGIDAPESHATRFGYAECYGKEASDFLKKFLPIGTVVEVIYYGNDKYQRELAEVFVNGESIAKTLIKNGYGWVYRSGVKPSNYQELLEIEKSLEGSSIGLWASDTCDGERRAEEILSNQKIWRPSL